MALWVNCVRRFSSSAAQKRLIQIEEKWKLKLLQGQQTTAEPNQRPDYYVLSMFPYPSGALHMGHARVYSISDCLAQYHRLKDSKAAGKRHPSVLHPIGWDAFGLPAENAALQRSISPSQWTAANIDQMRQQLRGLGYHLDWSRCELATSDRRYYRWTQWIFARMWERGLAYRAEGSVFWDPADKTVLAAEQVDQEGRSWRSGAKVEQRSLPQWYLRITDYAEDLLSGLDRLQWPEAVKDMQRHWIGKQEGCVLPMKIRDTDLCLEVEVFDHSNPMSSLQVNPGHPLAPLLQAKGVVIHPLTGDNIPVTLTDTVAVASPKHLLAVAGTANSSPVYPLADTSVFRRVTRYRMRDWLISRQRAWGTPIPIVYCNAETGCGAISRVPDAQLPVTLPETIKYPNEAEKRDDLASDLPASPLVRDLQWTKATCPKCGGPAHRETDTMDTFVDSSWYFLRYLDRDNEASPIDPSLIDSKKPVVDWYIGGVEHAILHLLYARFITKVLGEELGFTRDLEPFGRLLTQGLVQGKTFRCHRTGRYLRPEEPRDQAIMSWEKMSKSKLNGVEPGELVQRHGADCVRLGMLFKAPPAMPLNWDDRDIVGQERFLLKLLRLVEAATAQEDAKMADEAAGREAKLRIAGLFNETLQLINRDFNSGACPSFNVHIAGLMKITNALVDLKGQLAPSFTVEVLKRLAALLAPYAPITAHEIMSILVEGSEAKLSELMTWPSPLEAEDSRAHLAQAHVYLDGKFIGTLECDKGAPVSSLEATARRLFPACTTSPRCIIVDKPRSASKASLILNFLRQ
jgi:leucyl-tRNA synthetase